MSQKLWYLQQIELFKGIPKEEIMEIAQKVIEKHCSKKELIYTPFEPNDQVCVLKKGEVTLYHSHHGTRGDRRDSPGESHRHHQRHYHRQAVQPETFGDK